MSRHSHNTINFISNSVKCYQIICSNSKDQLNTIVELASAFISLYSLLHDEGCR